MNDISRKLPVPLDGGALDIAADKRALLRDLFPSVFTETKNDHDELVFSVDFERLKAELGAFTEVFESRRERYGMDWPGKKDCLKTIQHRSYATLKPVPEESVRWDSSDNLFIEGDNLEVLKLLQKSYYGKVKMIYIDPPYNTGNEFIYPDNYSESLETYLAYAKLTDEEGKRFATNTASEGRFHTKWLNMMYPRLYLARNLLTEDGTIFVSIDEHEIENLNRLMDEIYGESNRIATIVWKGATDNNPTRVAVEHEYIVCFAKDISRCPAVWKSRVSDAKDMMLAKYEELRPVYSSPGVIQEHFRRFIKDNSESLASITHYNLVDNDGVYTGSRKVHNPKPGGYVYRVEHPETGENCVLPANGYRFPEERMKELIQQKKIIFGDDHTQIVQIKEYLKDFEEKLSSVIHLDSRAGANEIGRLLGNRKVFTNPKPYELLAYIFDFQLDNGDILLDFFAGSCASAQAVMDLNARDGAKRKFIMVQLPERLDASVKEHKEGLSFCRDNGLPENIAEISKSRLRRALDRYSGEDARQAELTSSDADLGFRVFKLDKSNFRRWQQIGANATVDQIAEQLELHVEHVDPSASQEALLFEILLKAGFRPTAKVETVEMADLPLYSVASGALLICLAHRITKELIDAVAAAEPMHFFCLDSAFGGNDQLKANAVQTFAARNQGREKASQIVFRTV
ncbi:MULTISPECIES: site-specific DNA-methyltransferase [Cupriavidus]|uniref:site-specific DNA-methyltransferase (adenine-specific) n=4 Tax=Burkholderiaceae TaxID=119060 RepID=A0A375F9U3_9BURK|nr:MULTISPECIES: site-specific DNA-methyltransferase [Cupriavidus]MCO4865712.1 site-specific DNA-methyltransferase [Cupriavidus sp. WGlv3]MCO4893464.1 site-specific DNA-methyltransferase [Cupriavidus sp. WGtm5]ULX56047.1 restriction endonuclease subunit M [Cupriavidus taiwanensis]CAP63709.1 restriction modification Type III methylase [Cupriavidus taiwanensis LMG 19424]SOY73777.1 restriction modification Type III methylase [Cupriavidus taiwanensis]